jgi:Domain of unknown function (DUF1772)
MLPGRGLDSGPAVYGRPVDVLVDALRSVCLVGGAVLVGGMIMEYMLILPTQRQIPAADAARAFKIMSPIAWRYLPACGALTVTSAIALLVVWHWHSFPADAVGLTIAGIACFLPAVAVNLGLYLRADRDARAWTVESGDAEFHRLLERMAGLHTIRMALFGVGYVCFVIAAVLD